MTNSSYEPNEKIVSVRMPKSLLKRINKFGQESSIFKVPKSVAIRRLLEAGLEHFKNKNA